MYLNNFFERILCFVAPPSPWVEVQKQKITSFGIQNFKRFTSKPFQKPLTWKKGKPKIK